jgi:peptide/nickel transport system substrate-binding protein
MSRDEFERMFKEMLAGRLDRRDVMRTAGAAGAGLAALSVRGVGAQDASPVASPVAGEPTTLTGTLETADPAVKTGGTLRVGMQSDPGGLDPYLSSATALWHVVEHIYNRMTRIAPDLSVQLELAESIEVSGDGLDYTFKLRPGVRFHNGRELVADDVVYSYNRLVDPAVASTNASDLASMESVTAVDATTVQMRLKNPDAALLANLAGQSTIIIPREVVEENGDLAQVAVGTGPFKFIEYTPNTSVILEKNPDYFETGLPYLDGLELLIASEDTSRTTAVTTGTVDMIEYAPLRDIDTILSQDESIVLVGDSNTNIRMLGFNLRRAPFDNVLVRRAIGMVIDREAVLGPAVFGKGTPTAGFFPAEFWAALPIEIPAVDVEGAKALLAEAGFPDGFDTTITSWSEYSFLNAAAIVIQEQLKQIGINAELSLVDTGTMLSQVYEEHDFDMAVTGDSAYVDPNSILFNNFRTGEGGNFVGYSNPEVDPLLDEAIRITDQAQRADLYRRAQELILADAPWVNLFIANQFEALKTYVKGYEHIATGSNLFIRKVWLDQ